MGVEFNHARKCPAGGGAAPPPPSVSRHVRCLVVGHPSCVLCACMCAHTPACGQNQLVSCFMCVWNKSRYMKHSELHDGTYMCLCLFSYIYTCSNAYLLAWHACVWNVGRDKANTCKYIYIYIYIYTTHIRIHI